MESISRASLDQEIYLRGLTGYLVGKNLFDGYKKIAILAYPDRICSAISSAIVAGFLSLGNYKNESARVFLYEENRLGEIIKEIIKFDPDALFIAYGGEQKMSYVAEISKKTIEALMKNNYKKALVIHVRVWLATKQLSEILSNKELKDYLKSLKELRVFTADIQNKKFFFNRIKIEETAKLEKFKEENITDEHAYLLKISLPPQ